mgnify:CR=1 FL=1
MQMAKRSRRGGDSLNVIEADIEAAVGEGAHLAGVGARHERIAHPEGALLHQNGRHWPTPLVEGGFDDHTPCRAVFDRFELEHVGLQQQGIPGTDQGRGNGLGIDFGRYLAIGPGRFDQIPDNDPQVAVAFLESRLEQLAAWRGGRGRPELHHQPLQLQFAEPTADQSLAQDFQLLRNATAFRGYGGGHGGFRILHHLLEDGEKKVFLAPEILVNGPFADTGRFVRLVFRLLFSRD